MIVLPPFTAFMIVVLSLNHQLRNTVRRAIESGRASYWWLTVAVVFWAWAVFTSLPGLFALIMG